MKVKLHVFVRFDLMNGQMSVWHIDFDLLQAAEYHKLKGNWDVKTAQVMRECVVVCRCLPCLHTTHSICPNIKIIEIELFSPQEGKTNPKLMPADLDQSTPAKSKLSLSTRNLFHLLSLLLILIHIQLLSVRKERQFDYIQHFSQNTYCGP